MAVSGRKSIGKYYQDRYVASNYIEKRFSAPVYSAEHEKQIFILNNIIKDNKIRKILEIAPGPARITRHIKSNGTALENSRAMIYFAKRNMKSSKYSWKFVKGDAFNIKFRPGSFDMVFSFRFIRHFHVDERKRIFRQVSKVLKKGGLFVFEIPDRKKNILIRRIVGKDKYNIYDYLAERKEMISEIEDSGFRVVDVFFTTRHFFTQVMVSKVTDLLGIGKIGKSIIKAFEKVPGNSPLEWVFVCRKK